MVAILAGDDLHARGQTLRREPERRDSRGQEETAGISRPEYLIRTRNLSAVDRNEAVMPFALVVMGKRS